MMSRRARTEPHPLTGPVRTTVPTERGAGSASLQAIACSRLRKLYAASKIYDAPSPKWLFNMYYSMLRRALTDNECKRIVTLTDAAIKELHDVQSA